jgi:hypothetical protein
MAIVINGTGSISGLSNVGGIDLPQTGSVLQVVQGVSTSQFNTTSASYADIGLSATITPKYSTSKILAIAQVPQSGKNGPTDVFCKLVRNSTDICIAGTGWIAYTGNSNISGASSITMNYLDTPATTSATTYKVQACSETGGSTIWCPPGGTSTIILMEIAG